MWTGLPSTTAPSSTVAFVVNLVWELWGNLAVERAMEVVEMMAYVHRHMMGVYCTWFHSWCVPSVSIYLPFV